MTTHSTSPQKCIRCRADLPTGTTFCVACGCQNEGEVNAKRLSSVVQADTRIERARRIRDFLRPLAFWLWW